MTGEDRLDVTSWACSRVGSNPAQKFRGQSSASGTTHLHQVSRLLGIAGPPELELTIMTSDETRSAQCPARPQRCQANRLGWGWALGTTELTHCLPPLVQKRPASKEPHSQRKEQLCCPGDDPRLPGVSSPISMLSCLCPPHKALQLPCLLENRKHSYNNRFYLRPMICFGTQSQENECKAMGDTRKTHSPLEHRSGETADFASVQVFRTDAQKHVNDIKCRTSRVFVSWAFSKKRKSEPLMRWHHQWSMNVCCVLERYFFKYNNAKEKELTIADGNFLKIYYAETALMKSTVNLPLMTPHQDPFLFRAVIQSGTPKPWRAWRCFSPCEITRDSYIFIVPPYAA